MKPVFHKRDLQNKLDFFSLFRIRGRQRLISWAGISAGAITIVFLVLFIISWIASNRYIYLHQQEFCLNEKVLLLQQQVKQANPSLIKLLRVISDAISPETYLDSILCDNNSIEIRGGARQVEHAVLFYKKISEAGVLDTCQFKHIGRDSKHAQHVLFFVRGRPCRRK
ncbi:hypothetical protein KKA53_01045 [Candidatus Dependentiae bacterium]|nr:hypothetical protein [Candidatus Dependentiae bacterium]